MLLYIKFFFLGAFVKLITGFDDTITHVPVIASVTNTRIGKIAFSAGILLAISMAVAIALFFAEILSHFTYYRYISAGIIFLLAALIYFDVFVHRPRTKVEEKLLKAKRITVQRFTHLIGIGFMASIATVFDDIVAYLPLFLGGGLTAAFAAIGIFAAAILEIFLIICFSEMISKIPYKEKIASAGLVLLGILILTGIV